MSDHVWYPGVYDDANLVDYTLNSHSRASSHTDPCGFTTSTSARHEPVAIAMDIPFKLVPAIAIAIAIAFSLAPAIALALALAFSLALALAGSRADPCTELEP